MMLQTLRLSDGPRLSYLEVGQGEPLVLLHGVGMRAEAWQPQITAFAKSHRVIALDMPGHGASDLLEGNPSLPDYVAWAAHALRHLGCGLANVAGHSMGALIAAGLAVEHPDLVLRLAVLNGVYRRTAEARAAVQARAAALAAGANDIDVPLGRWFDQTPADQAVRAQVAQWLRAVTLAGYAAAYRAFADGDTVYAEAWPQISFPALVLTGSGDGNSTPEMARAMANAAARGRAVVIEGHRHMVNLTAPDQVNSAMADWLDTTLVAARKGKRA